MIIKCPKCGANNRVFPEADKQPVCGRCKEPLPSATSAPVTVTDANFIDVVEKSSLPVLLDLWAAWCGPCRMIAPTIEALAGEFAGQALVAKMDVDANPKTSARFRVQSIPMLLIIKDGVEVDRVVGLQSKEALAGRLKKFL